MIRAMTLWEAVSVFRAEPEALDEVFGSDRWRPTYFPLYHRVAEAVRVSDRVLLDTRLPTELTREVAARCHTLRFLYDPRQRVLHVAGCPTLLSGEQLEMTALEVHDRWGGSIMEEVLEFGSASVATDPGQEGFSEWQTRQAATGHGHD